MSKHELDNEVEDILKHWGIQGMKWDVRRTPEQIQSDAKNGVDAAGEALENAGDEVLGNDSIMEELGDVLNIVFGGKGDIKKQTDQLKDAVKDKVQDVSKEVKKRGYKMLENIFGTVEESRAKDRVREKRFINGMKAGIEASNKKEASKNKGN